MQDRQVNKLRRRRSKYSYLTSGASSKRIIIDLVSKCDEILKMSIYRKIVL